MAYMGFHFTFFFYYIPIPLFSFADLEFMEMEGRTTSFLII